MKTSALMKNVNEMWTVIAASDESDSLGELSEEALRGVSYAALATRGIVELKEGALPYIRAAFRELENFQESLPDEDTDSENEEE